MKPRSSAEGVVVAAGARPHAGGGGRGSCRATGSSPFNGHALRDAIDFSFHGSDARLALSVERDGIRHAAAPGRARADGRPWGVELEAPPRGGDRPTCANKCVFLLHPPAARRGCARASTSKKDDDFRPVVPARANYITLTDLGGSGARAHRRAAAVAALRVGARETDPTLRWEAARARPRRCRPEIPCRGSSASQRRGSACTPQVVLWSRPQRTAPTSSGPCAKPGAALSARGRRRPVVPVGAHAPTASGYPPLGALLTEEEAQALVGQRVAAWQSEVYLPASASRFVFLGDEVYLQGGGRPLPEADALRGLRGGGGRQSASLRALRGRRSRARRAASPARGGPAPPTSRFVSGTLYRPPRLERLVASIPRLRFGAGGGQFPKPILRRHRLGHRPADRPRTIARGPPGHAGARPWARAVVVPRPSPWRDP